jgi:phosphohistidine phosphatase SixA
MAQLPKSQRSNSRPGRRRRSRALPFLAFVFAAIVLAWFFESQATTTIIFVRHADTEVLAPADDPPLNARGRLRADLLADFLESVDVVAGVDAIYASSHRRTQETALPLASRLGLRVKSRDPYQTEAFMQDVLRDHKGDIVLIVSYADAIAQMIEELHGSKHVRIGADEHDHLYVVAIPWFGKVKTLHLRYGFGLENFERYIELDGGPRTQSP